METLRVWSHGGVDEASLAGRLTVAREVPFGESGLGWSIVDKRMILGNSIGLGLG